MPVNCTFEVLRDIVSKSFPSSKLVLIKYKDDDGDLVTITCTAELRLAESSADNLLPKEPDADKTDTTGKLRLHIVEVSPEQEPSLLQEEEEKPLETEGNKGDESVSHSSLRESVMETDDIEIDKSEKEAPKEKIGAREDPGSREVEMDDWLFEFAQLFQTHVGIYPDAHVDLHELGMELCSGALEETVITGKRIPLDESAGKEKIDLSDWDPTETLTLFDSAEEKMKAATEMWEKLEEQRANELKDPSASKKEELSRRRKKQEVLKVIPLTVLGMDGWKKNPDTAVERFRLAGASEAGISMVLKNHCSNGDALEGDEKEDKNGNADDGRESEKSKETDKV
ncbi:hypothetical protein GH714_005001 [Hevea brasiliensis]|uniref:PB1 domain-containing protein n=1 Tax=Hevea brasiliensis TaxID=3981 RepID=A0A6A6LFT2_HEVBR|nr:hypothetical protein GH714_005001 [Hevea brasiliensis]